MFIKAIFLVCYFDSPQACNPSFIVSDRTVLFNIHEWPSLFSGRVRLQKKNRCAGMLIHTYTYIHALFRHGKIFSIHII